MKSSNIAENGSMQFVQELRERLLGREMIANGRTIVDDQGAMLLSDDVELVDTDSVLAARNCEQLGGWFDCNQQEESEGKPAWHMLASEFSDSTLSQQGSGEFDPMFIITKLGAKVNRVIWYARAFRPRKHRTAQRYGRAN